MDREAQLVRPLAENGILYFLRVPQLQDGFGGARGAGLAYREVKLLGEIVDGNLVGLANRGRKLVGDISPLSIRLGEHQRGTYGVLHLIEGLGVSCLFVQNLDDME